MTRRSDDEWRAILDKEIAEVGGLDKLNRTKVAEKYGVDRKTLWRIIKRIYGDDGTGNGGDSGEEDATEEPKEEKNNGHVPSIDDIDPFNIDYSALNKIIRAEGLDPESKKGTERKGELLAYLFRKREQLKREKNPLLKQYEQAAKTQEEVIQQIRDFIKESGIPPDAIFDGLVEALGYNQPAEQQMTQAGPITRNQLISLAEEYGGVVLFVNRVPEKRVVANILRAYGWSLFDPNDPDLVMEVVTKLMSEGYRVINWEEEKDRKGLIKFLRAEGYIVVDTEDEDWIKVLKREVRKMEDIIIIDTDDDDWQEKLDRELRKYDLKLMDIEEFEERVKEEATKRAAAGITMDAAKQLLEENGYIVEKAVLTREELQKKLEEAREQWEKEFDLKIAKETEIEKMDKFSQMVENVVDTALRTLFGTPASKEEEEALQDLKNTTTEDLLELKKEWDMRKKKKSGAGKKEEKKGKGGKKK